MNTLHTTTSNDKWRKLIDQANQIHSDRANRPCSTCHGEKQKWNGDRRMMENCPSCNGSGKTFTLGEIIEFQKAICS